jgi:transaldolase
MKKIELYADGLNLDEFGKDYSIKIDGYTFNPSIFRKNGATNYLDYSKKIVQKSGDKPLSLEVFADDINEMINQAKILNSLSKNIYVKIPITFTNGNYTSDVLKELVKLKIKLNITAIFTMNQIKTILPIVKNSGAILSVFAGRIFDCGEDANEIMKDICNLVNKESNCKVLWASPRMTYDYINAINCGAKIITMQLSQIKKLKMFEKKLEDYSLDTVKQFLKDANESGYKL